MLVRELIEKLRKCDPEAQVLREGTSYDGPPVDVEEIEETDTEVILS